MKIIMASGNSGKIKEIKEICKEYEIYPLSEICEPFDIVENGNSFKENALIKSRAVYEKIRSLGLENEFISLSDDSGISVEALGFRPGIYSGRFSGKNANDKSNRDKLKNELKSLKLSSSPAFYTACIAISSKFGEFSTHGFMYGDVITEESGKNGFGYDFMFVPNGFKSTIGELSNEAKQEISHRSKALNLAKYILKSLKKYY